MEFLNRRKEKNDWDGEGIDDFEGLIEKEPHETYALITEIPEVSLGSDSTASKIVESPPALSQAALAAVALVNAKLATTPETDKIAGVNNTQRDNHAGITDDEASDANDDNYEASKGSNEEEYLAHGQDPDNVLDHTSDDSLDLTSDIAVDDMDDNKIDDKQTTEDNEDDAVGSAEAIK